MADGWRYYAYRLNGDATETLLATDVPLAGVQITQVLSGVNSMTASLPVEVARLKGADYSIFVPWSTAIYAELDGVIRGAGIVTQAVAADQSLSLTCTGFKGYLHGFPMTGLVRFIQEDPIAIGRAIVTRVQYDGSDLGLEFSPSPATSPRRLGLQPPSEWVKVAIDHKTPKLLPPGTGIIFKWAPGKDGGEAVTMWGRARDQYVVAENDNVNIFRRRSDGMLVEDDTGDGVPAGYDLFGVAYTKSEPTEDAAGNALEPYSINWWTDHDLGAKFDEVADLGSLDYVEDHAWDGERVRHTLRVGYPQIGRVRSDLRFASGENVTAIPDIEVDGDDYTDRPIVLGAGEGRDMIRGEWRIPNSKRLSRPKIYVDKGIRNAPAATSKATQLGKAWSGGDDIATLVVRNHPNAPIGSWSLGDTITYLGADAGWGAGRDFKVRILEQSIEPDNGDYVTLTVARADKVSFGEQ